MAQVNAERATLSAVAGAASAFIAYPAGAIWWLMDFDFALFATPEPPDAGDKFFAYVVAPAFLIAAGVLCARVVGARWRLSLVASVVASAFASVVVILSAYDLRALSSALILAPGLLALIVSVRTSGDAPAIPAVVFATGLLAILGTVVLSTELFGVAAVVTLSGWVILPAIAGLFQPATDRDTETDT